MALTAGNVTIKNAGGTYSSWQAFWDDLGDLTGDITCTVDASAFTENTAPAVVTKSLNGHTLHVLPASFPTKTDASDGARFTFNYTDIVLNLQMEGAGTVIIEGMVHLEGTSEPVRNYQAEVISTSFTLILRRNIVKDCNIAFTLDDATMTDVYIYNNIMINTDATSMEIKSVPSNNGIFANNTVINSDTRGISGGNLANTFENNLVYASAFADWINLTDTLGNNNASSDATGEDADFTGGGSDNLSNIADPFNALGSNDLTITAEGVIGTAGKDLSAKFTDDFFGTTRVNWTIGACEFSVPPQNVDLSVDAEIQVARKITHPASLSVDAEISAIYKKIVNYPVSLSVDTEIQTARKITSAVSLSVDAEISVTHVEEIDGGTCSSASVVTTFCSINVNDENMGLITKF